MSKFDVGEEVKIVKCVRGQLGNWKVGDTFVIDSFDKIGDDAVYWSRSPLAWGMWEENLELTKSPKPIGDYL